jgi:hypothetical protein
MPSPSSNYQFAFNGWIFGGPGAGVQILQVDGLEDMPSLRVQDDNRGFSDGMWTGRDFLNGRYITFTLQIMNDANGTMQTYLAELKTNLLFQQQGTGTLQFQLPGRSLQRVSARVRRRSLQIDPDYTFGKSIAVVELFAPDPRIYDDAAQGGVLTPGSTSGRTYNRVYPLLYNNSTGTSNAYGSFTNAGNVTVYPTFTLTGGMNTPIISNSTTGTFLKFNVVLAAADVLVVDTDTKTVTLNGYAARNLLDNTSDWFGFPAGTTTIGIVASGTSTGTLTVAYRNGYV